MIQYTTSQVAIEITNFVKTGTDYKGNLSTSFGLSVFGHSHVTTLSATNALHQNIWRLR